MPVFEDLDFTKRGPRPTTAPGPAPAAGYRPAGYTPPAVPEWGGGMAQMPSYGVPELPPELAGLPEADRLRQALFGMIGAAAPALGQEWYGPQIDFLRQFGMMPATSEAEREIAQRAAGRGYEALDVSKRFDIDRPRQSLENYRRLYEQLYGNELGQEQLRHDVATREQGIASGAAGMFVSGQQETAMGELGRRHGLSEEELGIRQGIRMEGLKEKEDAVDKLAAMYPIQRQRIADALDAAMARYGIDQQTFALMQKLAGFESQLGTEGRMAAILSQIYSDAIAGAYAPTEEEKKQQAGGGGGGPSVPGGGTGGGGGGGGADGGGGRTSTRPVPPYWTPSYGGYPGR